VDAPADVATEQAATNTTPVDLRPMPGECSGDEPCGSTVNAELVLEGIVLRESTLSHSPVLPYVRMIVGLIEGIRLGRRELVAILLRALRQHSFAVRKRIDYVLAFLHQHPP
jgi:hypothetical protein